MIPCICVLDPRRSGNLFSLQDQPGKSQRQTCPRPYRRSKRFLLRGLRTVHRYSENNDDNYFLSKMVVFIHFSTLKHVF
jgi:hypothetical protein